MSSTKKTFGKEWLSAPRRVGAIAPSGLRLAIAMTEGLSNDTGPIIELGPGTGVFTQALLRRGIAPQNLAAIELGTAFADALRKKHPDISVIEGDACRVDRLSPFERGSVGQVVCGLPLLAMPTDKIVRILAGSFKVLRQGGAFRLFTYGPGCPIHPQILERLGLQARRTSGTLRNLPPASVYMLTKQSKRMMGQDPRT